MSDKASYERKYKEGYGIQYPEGHVIRFYEKIYKNHLGLSGVGKRLLDFGCGNGIHSKYFTSKGFQCQGIDISSVAIEQAKQNCPYGKFMCIEPFQSLAGLFEETFDIVFANQSLYYLPKDVFDRTLMEMATILSDDGIVFFTMIGTRSYYFDISGLLNVHTELKEVALTGRLNEVTHMFFVSSKEEMIRLFNKWKPIFVGYYDLISMDGSGFHWYFVGKKP